MSNVIPGQFIVGHVDTQSPAAAAGLLPGDHIIQVYASKEFLLKSYFNRTATKSSGQSVLFGCQGAQALSAMYAKDCSC